jgi:hypothetical protein
VSGQVRVGQVAGAGFAPQGAGELRQAVLMEAQRVRGEAGAPGILREQFDKWQRHDDKP